MIVSPRDLRKYANIKVRTAVYSGLIKSARALNVQCTDCNSKATCYDHRDYTKPLDLDPVCASCNAKRGQGYPPVDSENLEVDWVSSLINFKDGKRFDLRMTKQERKALEKLAEIEGVTMTNWCKKQIRRAAKRAKVWK